MDDKVSISSMITPSGETTSEPVAIIVLDDLITSELSPVKISICSLSISFANPNYLFTLFFLNKKSTPFVRDATLSLLDFIILLRSKDTLSKLITNSLRSEAWWYK